TYQRDQSTRRPSVAEGLIGSVAAPPSPAARPRTAGGLVVRGRVSIWRERPSAPGEHPDQSPGLTAVNRIARSGASIAPLPKRATIAAVAASVISSRRSGA